ncbi:T9SS type A sorting domain-containing protein [Hymenobacter sp. M29]|uniref:T9SS type A sorting domain-containing protein n=1 Tax=Hymenobacter mellowenesis TaxID=3063995 RepID=A0ABT9AIP5_9BACT|nr:T9SS type A sorting domain-containing protein [Hymenobacter sp. M29]MDO7849438.1 T9SS type A sorting domain-containing protein [Hymenobacter sp. M29]
MKTYSVTLLLATCLLSGHAVLAQGPTIDPTFHSGEIFQPGTVVQAERLADGSTLMLGPFKRIAHRSTSALARLLPGGIQPDSLFQNNVMGLQGPVDRFVLLSNGKILLLDDIYYGSSSSSASITVGGVTRQALLQLNADGTPDAAFDAQLNPAATLMQALPQPDGKILLLGFLRPGAGQSGPVLVRLNADGSRDASFQPPAFLNAASTSSYPTFGALQADGRILLTGPFALVGGQPHQGVVRLLPTGALDATFQGQLPADVTAYTLAVQPDGKAVLTCGGGTSASPPLRRLLPDGSADTSFHYSGPLLGFAASSRVPPVAQPDGKILVATTSAFSGTTVYGHVLRFLPTGALDSGFDNAGAATGRTNQQIGYPGSVQLLAGGQVLITAGRAGYSLLRYAPLATSLPVGMALLQANGSRDASFAPLVQDLGSVFDLALQPDGKLLVGGSFSEINGAAVRNVARLEANGLVDASFGAAADDAVYALALQTDGKVLLGGDFDYLNSASQPALGRVLSTGARDANFSPPIPARTLAASSSVQYLALRTTGEIIAAGTFRIQQAGSSAYRVMAQFLAADGQADGSFQTATPAPNFVQGLLLQPGGKLVVVGSLPSGSNASIPVWRLLPTGALDPSFTTRSSVTGDAGLAVAQDGTGRLYVTGTFDNLGAPGNHYMARLLADGQPDPSFQVTLPGLVPLANTIAIQPNGRVLLGGELSSTASANPNPEGTLRLLPTGAPDNSYNPAAGPVGADVRTGYVRRLLIQPNGAILAAGGFPQVGSLPFNGLVRLLDANMLAVNPGRVAPATAAWPVPAHEVLHLALDAASRPRQVELLDALGRVVLSQAVAAPELSLPTAGLAPGVYLLRVRYDVGGAVGRRVVLE